MRRSTLFLLMLHLAAGPVLAQTLPPLPPTQPAAPAQLEVRSGERVATFPLNGPASATPQPLAPPSEALTTFDPQHAEVAWSQNHWQLVADGQLLKDFGRREVEARVAQRLVRDLHLTEHGVVGGPQPVMEYWLSNGRAPAGLASGLHQMTVDPQQLRIEQTQGQWTLREPNRVLFSFGPHESDARNALAIINKYHFNQIGYIGEAGPSMIVMLGRPDSATSDPNMPHLTRQPPLHPAAQNDPHAGNVQQAKFNPGDNTVLTPVIPPLHSPTDTHKEGINAFGKMETVDVLPQNDPSKLRRTPPLTPLATDLIDRTTFDWRQVQLRQEGAGQVVLSAGSLVLGHFNNDHDGRLAQAALQHYRFTEVNKVGRPQAFASYFLGNNETPMGQYLGVHTEAFFPEKLTVTQVENRWAIVSPDKTLLWFGTKAEEAQVMLDVIQRHKFDRLCHIGDERGMMFFVRSH